LNGSVGDSFDDGLLLMLEAMGRFGVCHYGARVKRANPESGTNLREFIWIPGPALRAVPE
jgi:hypothetical protein